MPEGRTTPSSPSEEGNPKTSEAEASSSKSHTTQSGQTQENGRKKTAAGTSHAPRERTQRTPRSTARTSSRTSVSARENAASDASSLLSGSPSKHSVTYPDGSSLARPLTPPASMVKGTFILVAAAAVIGAIFLGLYFDNTFNGPVREQERLEENIAKQVDTTLPVLTSLIPLDDASILAALQQNGDVLYEKVPAGSGKPFELIKLPPDVTLADAAVLYVKGISSLTPSEAALLLNGSWDLTVNRDNGLNISLHFADFTSGSLELAVSNAAHSQGFDTENATDSGVDTSGNTFITGTTSAGDATYSWRVSAIPLSDIYDQKGFPETAAYVGIRVYS